MPGSYLQPMPEVEGVEHIYVNAGGLRTHVATAGPESGKPVMLLHGWPQHWWLWRNVMPSLAAAGYRVYAPDLRGMGWSEATERPCDYDKRQFARDIIALLDTLEIDKVRLAGHDWGGWTGFIVAITAPERVDRYLALNIAPPWLDPGPFDLGKVIPALWRLRYQVALSTPGVSQQITSGRLRSLLSGGMIEGSTNKDVWTDEVVDTYLNQFKSPKRGAATKFIYRQFLTKELPQAQFGKYVRNHLETNTKILFGVNDIAVDSSVVVADHSRFAPNLVVDPVENCGHFIVDEQPELVASKMLDFFA